MDSSYITLALMMDFFLMPSALYMTTYAPDHNGQHKRTEYLASAWAGIFSTSLVVAYGIVVFLLLSKKRRIATHKWFEGKFDRSYNVDKH